jgi:hypothetical protein
MARQIMGYSVPVQQVGCNARDEDARKIAERDDAGEEPGRERAAAYRRQLISPSGLLSFGMRSFATPLALRASTFRANPT